MGDQIKRALALLDSLGHQDCCDAIEALVAERDRLKKPIDSYACQRCGRADGLDAVLPNADWERVSQAAEGVNILCLWCMDEIAESLGIKRSASLHFCGKALSGTSQSDADQDHVSRLVTRIAELEAENERLKSLGRAHTKALRRLMPDDETLQNEIEDMLDAADPAFQKRLRVRLEEAIKRMELKDE